MNRRTPTEWENAIILRTTKILGWLCVKTLVDETLINNGQKLFAHIVTTVGKSGICLVFSRTFYLQCAGEVKPALWYRFVSSNTIFDDNRCLFLFLFPDFCEFLRIKNKKHRFSPCLSLSIATFCFDTNVAEKRFRPSTAVLYLGVLNLS